MLRVLTKDDVKKEFQDKVVKLVFCPVVQQSQAVLMCFACSRLRTCKKAFELGISALEVEDIVHDAAFFRKATRARKQDLSSSEFKRKKIQGVKKMSSKEGSSSKTKTKVLGGSKMKANKKNEIMEFLKTNPDATPSSVKEACNVSYVYASKVIKAFKAPKENDQNPPQGS